MAVPQGQMSMDQAEQMLTELRVQGQHSSFQNMVSMQQKLCFDKCVDLNGDTKLSKREQSCLGACQDSFQKVMQDVQEVFIERNQQSK